MTNSMKFLSKAVLPLCGFGGLLSSAVLATSCGGGSMAPRQLIALAVQPSSTIAIQGDAVSFSATGTFDQAPTTQPNMPAQWTSSDASIATIDPNTGKATCITLGGPVTITASTSGKAGMLHSSGALTCAISPNPVPTLSDTTLKFECNNYGGWGCHCGSANPTLTNTGGATLAIDSIAIMPTWPFSQTNDCGSSLEPAQLCHIAIKFYPTWLGSFSAALMVTDNAAGSPQGIALQGTANCHH
jgi:hypothetical protein